MVNIIKKIKKFIPKEKDPYENYNMNPEYIDIPQSRISKIMKGDLNKIPLPPKNYRGDDRITLLDLERHNEDIDESMTNQGYSKDNYIPSKRSDELRRKKKSLKPKRKSIKRCKCKK